LSDEAELDEADDDGSNDELELLDDRELPDEDDRELLDEDGRELLDDWELLPKGDEPPDFLPGPAAPFGLPPSDEMALEDGTWVGSNDELELRLEDDRDELEDELGIGAPRERVERSPASPGR
jgi:hypothetical protein